MKQQHTSPFISNVLPQKGKLLLAEPHLSEAFFERAVVLLIEHNQEESFGLVLNHPTAIQLSDLFEHIEIDLPIYQGGPVAPEQLFYLHRFRRIKGAIAVSEGLYFGGVWKEVLIQAHLVKRPELHLRLFAGYAGWDEKQLDEEIAAHSWICTEQVQLKALFQTKPELLWKKCLLEQGPELAIYAHFPVNISDN